MPLEQTMGHENLSPLVQNIPPFSHDDHKTTGGGVVRRASKIGLLSAQVSAAGLNTHVAANNPRKSNYPAAPKNLWPASFTNSLGYTYGSPAFGPVSLSVEGPPEETTGHKATQDLQVDINKIRIPRGLTGLGNRIVLDDSLFKKEHPGEPREGTPGSSPIFYTHESAPVASRRTVIPPGPISIEMSPRKLIWDPNDRPTFNRSATAPSLGHPPGTNSKIGSSRNSGNFHQRRLGYGIRYLSPGVPSPLHKPRTNERENPIKAHEANYCISVGGGFMGPKPSQSVAPPQPPRSIQSIGEEGIKGKGLINYLDISTAKEPPPETPRGVAVAQDYGRPRAGKPEKLGIRGSRAWEIALSEKWAVIDHQFNIPLENISPNAKYFIIKSNCELDVYSAMKFGIWTSTELGNRRLDRGFRDSKGPVYLFFSVSASGQFCAVAEMTSSVDFQTETGIWTDKRWKGRFQVKWVFIKDIPNNDLRSMLVENNENKPVTNCRDTQEIMRNLGETFLLTFSTFRHTSSLFQTPAPAFPVEEFYGSSTTSSG